MCLYNVVFRKLVDRKLAFRMPLYVNLLLRKGA